jgi:hypothetical protein
MNWHIKGQYIEACSCKMLCPCLFGPAEPDQGWCSGQLTFDIQDGGLDGIELRGRKVILVFDLPGDFVTGNNLPRRKVSAVSAPNGPVADLSLRPLFPITGPGVERLLQATASRAR